MRKCFMVIISHMQFGNRQFLAQDIIQRLLENRVWLFATTTGKISTLMPDDFGLIYAAGNGNRCFVGNFTLASKPKLEGVIKPGLEDLLAPYPIASHIKDAQLWATPVLMKTVVNELGFIQNKKNYGLYLRQGMKMLAQEDVDVILSARVDQQHL